MLQRTKELRPKPRRILVEKYHRINTSYKKTHTKGTFYPRLNTSYPTPLSVANAP